MIEDTIKLRAGRDRFNPFDLIELACIEYKHDDNGKRIKSVAKPLSMEPIEPDLPIPSFCTLTREQAQLLMDDLWQTGLRPSEGTGSAGAMKAVQNHLEDMRQIVFKKLGIK